MRDRHASLQKQIQDVCYVEATPVNSRAVGSNLPLTPVEENQVSSPMHGSRMRTKAKPNLTIRVNGDRQKERPPPPPPKSPPPPPLPRKPADYSPKPSPQRESHFTTAWDGSSEPPRTPIRAVAQQQSYVPLSAGLKIRELTVSPPSESTRRSQQPKRAIHDLLPNDFLEKPLPPGPQAALEPPASKFSLTNQRPSTSDGARHPASDFSHGNVSPNPSRGGLLTSRSTDQISQPPPRISLRSRLLPGSRGRQSPAPPSKEPISAGPETERRIPKPDWKDLADPASHYPRRSITPEPARTTTGLGRLYTPIDPVRPSSAQSNYSDHAKNRPVDSRLGSEAGGYTSTESRPSAALAAARANVAALRDSGSSVGSPGRTERSSRSSGAEAPGLTRARSDLLLRRPSSPYQPDAVETLKELSEESEALHTRYATLRTERQKLSSRIIAVLRDEAPSTEQTNMLLDDQLSLAAVSSSMDICFAKLKSLDCRKEDAITNLIAKATQAPKTPSDNIATMIASMAVSRKASLAKSQESSNRFTLTGRSTPEPGDSFSMHNRSARGSSTRTLSYGSDAEGSDYRYSSQSRKHSYSGEGVHRPDSFERPTHDTIPEVAESPLANAWSSVEGRRSSEGEGAAEFTSADLPVVHGGNVTIDFKHASGSEPGVDLEVFDQNNKRIRVTGSKAARILGLLEDADQDDNDAALPAAKSPADAENEGLMYTDDSGLDSGGLPSSDVHDLENQLKSFPRPNAALAPSPAHRRDTGGSNLTNGSSADSGSEPEPLPPRRRGTNKRTPDPSRKRDPSAHTIHVHLDRNMDHEELLEYYRRLRPDLDSHS